MADKNEKPKRRGKLPRAHKILPTIKLVLEDQYANVHESRPKQGALKRATKTLGIYELEIDKDIPNEKTPDAAP